MQLDFFDIWTPRTLLFSGNWFFRWGRFISITFCLKQIEVVVWFSCVTFIYTTVYVIHDDNNNFPGAVKSTNRVEYFPFPTLSIIWKLVCKFANSLPSSPNVSLTKLNNFFQERIQSLIRNVSNSFLLI